MDASELDDMIADQAATKQVLLMALRRLAALTRESGRDPRALAARWKTVGRHAMDTTEFGTAPEHEASVRAEAKARLDEIIEIGLLEPPGGAPLACAMRPSAELRSRRPGG